MTTLPTAVFDTKSYDRESLQRGVSNAEIEWRFMDWRLSAETAASASGARAVCIFVNDRADRPCLEALASLGVKHIALRCAGYNGVDVEAATELGLAVTRVPAYSPYAVAEHADARTLAGQCEVISLHTPLTPETYHIIRRETLELMKPGTILINVSRGALIDTTALIEALKSGRLGGVWLDVYEEEEGVFFEDLSGQILQDDELARLLTFPNVLITAHQAFLTREALSEIARVTVANLIAFDTGQPFLAGTTLNAQPQPE